MSGYDSCLVENGCGGETMAWMMIMIRGLCISFLSCRVVGFAMHKGSCLPVPTPSRSFPQKGRAQSFPDINDPKLRPIYYHGW